VGNLLNVFVVHSFVLSKADVHVHTRYSGFGHIGPVTFPESISRPEDVVDIARRIGLRVLCITDHNSIRGAQRAQEYAKRYDDIEVVVGSEISAAEGEIIGLFLQDDVPKGRSVRETIDMIRAQGGLVVAPHPFSCHVPALGELVDELDIDALEILNGGHLDGYANEAARRHAQSGRWAVVGGSDAHALGQLGCSHTTFPGETVEDFRRAVLNRTTEARGRISSLDMGIKWTVEIVLKTDLLMLRSFFGLLEGDDPEDPLIRKINVMRGEMKLAALVSSMIFLTPPIPILTSVTGVKVMRELNRPKPKALPACDARQ
jgi:predicted metal-dependent phosphoesterase TrpH